MRERRATDEGGEGVSFEDDDDARRRNGIPGIFLCFSIKL